MRILGGFDSDYSGFVGYNDNGRHLSSDRRIVGWCPQSDPLFEYLTVREHLEMFLSLLSVGSSSNKYETNLLTILSRVNLVDHATKRVHMLSGGMKRRLSLLLACLGDPCVLLLDEPTSGCDSYTRELVRKDIIGKKHSCAILISTHHIDDVEIISDQVWFLNEHNLIYNGPLVDLHDTHHRTEVPGNNEFYQAQTSTPRISFPRASLSSVVEFSTSSSKIQRDFLDVFPDQRLSTSTSTSSHSGTVHSWSLSMSSPNHRSTLHQFIERLESQGFSQWSLVSPNAYKSLSRMYDITEATYQQLEPHEDEAHSEQNRDPCLSQCHMPPGNVEIASRRLFHLIKLRALEVRSQPSQFLLTQLMVPFFVVLFLVFACGDVRYPKLQLQSESIGGIGEILVMNGKNGTDNRAARSVLWEESQRRRKRQNSTLDCAVHDEDSLVWKGSQSSDQLFTELSKEYFDHRSNRWASFVVDDTIDQWLQSRVRIPKESLQLSFDEILSTLSHLQSVVCENQTQKDPLHLDPRVSSKISSNKIKFCSHLSSIEFNLMNETSSASASHSQNLTHGRGNLTHDREVLVITAYQSLHSNLTMMTNITTDHGSPIFLKEIAPYIYNSFQSFGEGGLGLDTNSTILNAWNEIDGTPPSYSLFSHPFDDATNSSSSYIERGYLGALLVILYILLISSVSVKFITNNNHSGAKTQIHLCGVSPLIYWIANFLFDSFLLLLTLSSIYLAILLGGAPIRNFFFLNDSGILFFASLGTFSCASVAANYSFAVLSHDQISSQLFALMTAISSGIFLKLFISLQGSVFPFPQISSLCLYLSPSYAFSSCLFEMFTRYVKLLGKSVGIISSDTVPLSMQAVYFPLVVMCFQTLFYLILTVVIDTHWYPLVCRLQSLWDQFHHWIEGPRIRTDGRVRSLSFVSVKETLFHYIDVATSVRKVRVATLNGDSDQLQQSPADLWTLPSEPIGKTLERAISLSKSPPPSPLSERYSHSQHSLLFLDNLSVKYPFAATETLKALDLKINSGERVALMGINGGGKSSLFKTLSTKEMTPVSGRAILDGCDTVTDSWRLGEIHAIGYVPQEGGLLEYLTVKEALDFFTGLRETQSETLNSSRHQHHQGIIQAILPKKYLPYAIKSLSGGNKKKLSVVLSNLNSPSLLLFDEPSSGVDPAAAERIISYLANLPPHQAMIFASHRLDECLRICRRVFMLYGGRIQFDGDMTILDSISDLFYQIDVSLVSKVIKDGDLSSPRSPSPPEDHTALVSEFLDCFRESLQRQHSSLSNGGGELERVVVYNPSLVRMTLEKNLVPFSRAWTILDQMSQRGAIDKYSFRRMDMEEIFAIILSDSPSQTPPL
jgi:ABC-type multidrug transport system ATPase subunit